MKSQMPPAETSKTAAERYPEFSPMKSMVPPNHITMKNGTTIPPAIKPSVLDSDFVCPCSEAPRSSEGGLLEAKLDSPVCCCAAFCRSPPLVMMNNDVKETVIKQSPRRLQLRAFRGSRPRAESHCRPHRWLLYRLDPAAFLPVQLQPMQRSSSYQPTQIQEDIFLGCKLS